MPVQAVPLFPGVPGGMELAVILLIAVLLFGANKIPKLARSTGEAMGEFKKGREQVEQELEEIREGGEASAASDVDTTPSTETPSEPVSEPEGDLETESESAAETDEK